MSFLNYSVKFFSVTIISYFIYNIIKKYKKKEIVYKIYNHNKNFFLKWKKYTEIKMLYNLVDYLISQHKKEIIFKINNQKKRFFLKWKKNTEFEVLSNIVDYLVSQPKQK
jgi:hypothetical protein